jgi:hypothetical protein
MTLRELADSVDNGLRWRSVWPSFHACCNPVDDGYADRLGILFDAVQVAADVKYRDSLSNVLKAHHKNGTLGGLIRQAATRTEQS